MSEQMSAREIVHEIRRDSPFGGLTYDQCEALILADRKATVDRCKEELRNALAYGSLSRALKALDAVLED